MAKRIQVMAGDTKCGSPLAIFCIPTQFVAAPLAIFCIPTHFVGDTLSGATPVFLFSEHIKINDAILDIQIALLSPRLSSSPFV